MAEASPWIIETAPQDFQTEVVDRSYETPIVIDFWAPWCGPCKALGPRLEKLTREASGKFLLMKVNTDENQELAGAFGVSSIPAVFAVRDGQVVDQFVGLLEEDELRQWLSVLQPSPGAELIARAAAIEPDDPAGAEQLYREALGAQPDNDAVRISLARVLLAQGRDQEARRIIDELAKRGFLEPEAEQIQSKLDLRASAAQAGDLDDVRAAAEANPDDLAQQLKLADALAVRGDYEAAMEICLDVVRRDRSGAGEQARESMVKIFDLIGPETELVSRYRRKLATALY
jgi:putative thioredoxin